MSRQHQQQQKKRHDARDDDDEDTTISITRGLKRQFDALYTKDYTYQEILTEALEALKEKRKRER